MESPWNAQSPCILVIIIVLSYCFQYLCIWVYSVDIEHSGRRPPLSEHIYVYPVFCVPLCAETTLKDAYPPLRATSVTLTRPRSRYLETH